MEKVFQVGDIVYGIGFQYGVTNVDMTEGEVIKVNSDHTFTVRILNHRLRNEVGEIYSDLDPKHFGFVNKYNTEPISKEDFLSIFE